MSADDDWFSRRCPRCLAGPGVLCARLFGWTTRPHAERSARRTPIEQVRTLHRYGFRSGQWAQLVCEVTLHGRRCWFVEFPDGTTDSWVVDDPESHYERRIALPSMM